MTRSQSGYLIRDAVPGDVEACLNLDSAYTSDYVWQMNTQKSQTAVTILFKQERLPRTIEQAHVMSGARLKEALTPQHCFLVVAERETQAIWAYLTMRGDVPSGIALIQDMVVDSPYRRHGIGRKLFMIARQWATEREYQRLMVEIETKNYPMIQFVQGHGLAFCGYNDQYYMNQEIALFFGQSLR